MPDVYVFPGGGVERGDATAPTTGELRRPVARAASAGGSAELARALAVAALRETWEETGLVFGRVRDGAIEPALDRLDYVARAITPRSSPIRFHARFFQIDARHARGRLRGNGELLDLAWVPLARAASLPMIDVTQIVIAEVGDRLAGRRRRTAPLVCYRGTHRFIRRG